MSTYVLVHGAWHTGAELEPTAALIRAAGHEVHTPTIAGNRPGDAKTIGLAEAIKSIVDYLMQKNLSDVVMVGHSYGGMVITGVVDQVPDRIRRLIYWNAFVPNNDETLIDMVPPSYVALFDQISAQRGDRITSCQRILQQPGQRRYLTAESFGQARAGLQQQPQRNRLGRTARQQPQQA